MSKDMMTSRALVLSLLFVVLSEPVLADCADVAAPGVYWRRCLQDGQDLRGVDLTGGVLRDASFKRTDLSEALLIDADARRAKFISSTLRAVTLDGANLERADLTKADLTEASLKNVNFTAARLFRADLSGADLTGARLDRTDLLKAKLDGATWVDGVTICAPGSIGICQRERADPEASGVEASG